MDKREYNIFSIRWVDVESYLRKNDMISITNEQRNEYLKNIYIDSIFDKSSTVSGLVDTIKQTEANCYCDAHVIDYIHNGLFFSLTKEVNYGEN